MSRFWADAGHVLKVAAVLIVAFAGPVVVMIAFAR